MGPAREQLVDHGPLFVGGQERIPSLRGTTILALEVTTLAAEAGVARQDLYQTYRHLLDEFRTHVKRLKETPATPDRQSHQIQRLKEQFEQAVERAGRYRAERNDARRQRDANASQVAYLDDQNRLLRQQLDAASRITPLHR